jgi:hypothetical protein
MKKKKVRTNDDATNYGDILLENDDHVNIFEGMTDDEAEALYIERLKKRLAAMPEEKRLKRIAVYRSIGVDI